jgi:hypothetical protein
MSQILAGKFLKVTRCPIVDAYYTNVFKEMVFTVNLTAAET